MASRACFVQAQLPVTVYACLHSNGWRWHRFQVTVAAWRVLPPTHEKQNSHVLFPSQQVFLFSPSQFVIPPHFSLTLSPFWPHPSFWTPTLSSSSTFPCRIALITHPSLFTVLFSTVGLIFRPDLCWWNWRNGSFLFFLFNHFLFQLFCKAWSFLCDCDMERQKRRS